MKKGEPMKDALDEFTAETRRQREENSRSKRLSASPLCLRASVMNSVRASACWLALSLLALLFALPFLWMVSTSLKGERQVFSIPVQWLPRPAHWENYPIALAAFPFWRYLGNTLLLCASTVAGSLISSAPPAYAFARIPFRGREGLFILMLCTIMLPAQATMLPVFLLFRWLHWIGTFRPLWVPSFFGSAFYIFLLRQFFRTIPRELSDAARIDGCGEAGIFWRVVLPLAKPALATIALFTFIGTWTDYLGPLVYLHDERQFTLALGLTAFLGRHGAEWNYLMAASTVVTA